MTDFQSAWTSRYGSLCPIGYLLRYGEAKHWLRFHSLPESKRYPDNADERAQLLARQNVIAEAVLGDRPCWLVQSHWETPEGVVDRADEHDPFRATRDHGLRPAFRFVEEDEDDEDPRAWMIHAAMMAWRPGGLDDLLLAIAEERAGPTLWMSASDGAVFAPYDGGVDLFLPNTSAVRGLRKTYPDWLSAHPEGL